MDRTRAAVLRAADECVERYGVRRTTMVDIASRSGVAKATLYNHFRTKDDVLVALVEAQVAGLVAECAAVVAREHGRPAPRQAAAARSLAAALAHAAGRLSTSRALRRVAADEPALLASLAGPGQARAWETARRGVEDLLRASRAASGPAAVDLVLRWLVAHLTWPGSEQAAEEAALLAAALTADAGLP